MTHWVCTSRQTALLLTTERTIQDILSRSPKLMNTVYWIYPLISSFFPFKRNGKYRRCTTISTQHGVRGDPSHVTSCEFHTKVFLFGSIHSCCSNKTLLSKGLLIIRMPFSHVYYLTQSLKKKPLCFNPLNKQNNPNKRNGKNVLLVLSIFKDLSIVMTVFGF